MNIENEHQRHAAAAQRNRLQHELTLLLPDSDDPFVQLQRASLLGVIADLDRDIDAFDRREVSNLAAQVVDLAAALPPMRPEEVEQLIARVKAAVTRHPVTRRRIPVRLSHEQITALAAAVRYTRDHPLPGERPPGSEEIVVNLSAVLDAVAITMTTQPASAQIDLALERRAALAAFACASYALGHDATCHRPALTAARDKVCDALDPRLAGQ